MKIVTYNINSIRMRLERLLAWVDAQRPDVLCLQETKVTDDLFPRAPFEERGYHVALWGQKTYNGVAIVARAPLSNVARGFGDGEDEPEARLIAADVDGVRVMNAYVPNGQAPGTEKYQKKLRWMARMANHVGAAAAGGAPVVVVGDFNVAPEDRDVHDPARWAGQIHCSEPERAALQGIVAAGLVDGFRQLRPEAGLYTWWDYRQLSFPKNKGLRIDHILVTPSVAGRLREASIDREARKGAQPSDHAPVIAVLD
jgi:exodeoxyribonuclease-3